jgi:uncharacterized delta-60 repeat protein
VKASHVLFLLLLPVFLAVWAFVGTGRQSEPVEVAVSASKTQAVEARETDLLHQKPIAVPGVAPSEDVHQVFRSWLSAYALASAEQRAVMLEKGQVLAEARLADMLSLIQTNPERALELALTESQRRTLPPRLLPMVEERIAGRADLSVRAVTRRPGLKTSGAIQRELAIGDKTWTVHVFGRRAEQDTQYQKPVTGIAVKGHAAVHESDVRVIGWKDLPDGVPLEAAIQVGERHSAAEQGRIVQMGDRYTPVCCAAHAQKEADRARGVERQQQAFLEASGGNANTDSAPDFQPSSHTSGAQSLLVIIADFSDKPGVPVDEDSGSPMNATFLNNRISTQVAPYVADVSYGTTSLSPVTVTSLLRLSGTLASYAKNNNPLGLKNAAMTAATTAGFQPQNFDRVILVFADTLGITGNQWEWAGLADLGGKFIWNNGWFTLGTVAHEVIHTYGVRHANLWLPPAGSVNPTDLAGQSLEYADSFDVMGEGPYDVATKPDHPNPWFLRRMGWLPGTAVRSVSASGSYRLHRFDHPSASLTNPLALYVDRDGTRQYWLGFRKKYAGHASHGAAGQGATLVWGYRSNTASDLIDISPLTDQLDAPLAVGSTFDDTAAGVSFQVTGQGGTAPNEYLDVQVTYQPRVVPHLTSVTVDEKAGSVQLKVQRRSNSAGAISVDFSTQAGTAGGSDFTHTSGTLSWADGDMATKTITVPITNDTTVESTETFTVRLLNATGCVLSHGNIINVRIADPGQVDTLYTHDELLGSIYDAVVQPDGRAVVVGQFSSYGPVFSPGIARLEADGSVDTSFEQGEGADVVPVSACARQSDGKIIVGGMFKRIRGETRNFIARLNANGTLDSTFNAGTGPNIPGAAYAGINCITLQPDGKILVGGEFTTWSGSTRKCLVRLNTDGSLDSSFPNLSSLVEVFSGANGVRSIAIAPSSTAPHFSIVIGGAIRVTPANPGTKSGVIRLNSDGSKDTSFDLVYGAHQSGSPNTAYPVTSVSVQPDGKLIVGGQFTGFNNAAAKGIVRLNTNGTNDSAFVTASGAGLGGTIAGITEVSRLLIQPDGGIIVAGYFTTASGATGLKGLTRYLGTGARDTAFVPNISSAEGVNAAVLQPDNRLLIGFWDSVDGTKFMRYVTTGIGSGRAGELSFTTASSATTEGSSSAVIVQRTGGSKGAVSVNYHTASGTATEGQDFSLQSGVLTWADGDTTTRIIQVATSTDAAVESTESFTLTLANPLGAATLGNTAVHTISVTDAPSNQPLIGFNTASSNVTEATSAVQIGVSLSGPAASGPVSATLLLTGTATSGEDYTLASSTVTITPPATSALITLNITQDQLLESTETVVLTLSGATGGIVNSPASTHTVSIADDEVAASISTPSSAIVQTGHSVTFSVIATGSPTPSLQWFKGGTLLTGQTASSLTLNNVQLSDAGDFSCVASTGSETLPSGVARLAVVDTTNSTRALNLGGSVTLSITTAGSGLSYSWRRGSTTLVNNTKVSGATTRTITIKNLASTDAGSYVCHVTSSAGTATSGLHTLNLVTAAPIGMPPVPLPEARVSAYYDPDGGATGLPIPFNTTPSRTPASWSQVGLPSGMAIHPTTGVISGRPKVSRATAYPVTITVSNARGKHTSTTSILVRPMPTHASGNFIALLDRQDPLNSRFGGRIRLTILTSGEYTGTLNMGPHTYPITGRLVTVPGSEIVTSTATVSATGFPPLTLSFTIDGSTGKLTSGSLSRDGLSLPFTGWKQLPATMTQQGYYTAHLLPPVSPYNTQSIPQGVGFIAISVTADGLATVSGRLADTTTFTSNGAISDDGQIVLFSTLYTLKGSLHGMLKLNGDSVQTSGSITWHREAQSATARSYRGGFDPFPLLLNGARYTTTLSPDVLVQFAPFDCEMPPPLPDVQSLLGPTGIMLNPLNNLRKTKLTLSLGKGTFSGTFTLVDPNPMNPLKYITRTPGTGFYYGVVVSDPVLGPHGLGHFTLPNLPSPGSPTSTTTPIHSGQVLVDNP